MRNQRENLISLLRREGYDYAPVGFGLCPSLKDEFKKQTGVSSQEYMSYFNMPWKDMDSLRLLNNATEDDFKKYYPFELKKGAYIDIFGVAHEPGSAEAKHMTYMRNPMCEFADLEQFKAYPYPNVDNSCFSELKAEVEETHKQGLASVGNMQMTIWETSWYMRGMETLMTDMMLGEPAAEYHLNRIMELAVKRAVLYANAGVDILFLGDDIGMQQSIMMSKDLYRAELKPRLKHVVNEVRKVKKDIIIFYHSCGYITPLIEDLIDAGIDVLNPVQPECMCFEEIYKEYGDVLSFHGTIGTQSTMPFGTVGDVKNEIYKNLSLAGDKGGLFCAPTHVLEPEVPWENIIAYVESCRSFKKLNCCL